MNGKQAKRLRRAALGLAATLDQNGKKIHKDGHVVQEHRVYSPSSISAQFSSDPAAQRDVEPPTISYTVHNRPDSLRALYRTIKKGVVTGKIKNPPK